LLVCPERAAGKKEDCEDEEHLHSLFDASDPPVDVASEGRREAAEVAADKKDAEGDEDGTSGSSARIVCAGCVV
jgi:hypothetical protein